MALSSLPPSLPHSHGRHCKLMTEAFLTGSASEPFLKPPWISGADMWDETFWPSLTYSVLGQGCGDYSIVFGFAYMSRTHKGLEGHPLLSWHCSRGIFSPGQEGVLERQQRGKATCQAVGFLPISSLCGSPKVPLSECSQQQGKRCVCLAGWDTVPTQHGVSTVSAKPTRLLILR